ncbi:MAG: hypothetical protein GMKNLPBB_00497 [Myxococcota bacterium]|nr:hypothetical protein [Myxococcota bacterium]
MDELIRLLRPKWQTVRNLPRASENANPLRARFFGAVGLGFWLALFGATWWILRQLARIEYFADAIASKLLSFAFMSFFFLLVFSAINSALSTYYLAEDLILLHAMPVKRGTLFAARFWETFMTSSWMVWLLGTPILAAYGAWYKAGPLFYVTSLLALLPFLMIPVAIGVLATMVLVSIIPAWRLRELTLLTGILGIAGLFVYFRLLRPEQFLNPEGFASVATAVRALETPESDWLPSLWLRNVVFPMAMSKPPGWDHAALLFTTGPALFVIAMYAASGIYNHGFSRSQEGRPTGRVTQGALNLAAALMAFPFRNPTRGMLIKDLKLFFRDAAQWTQLLLLGALVIIYVVNAQHFKVIGDTGLLTWRGLYILNTGLVSFIQASVAVRFVFSAVSLEGKSFWLVRVSPVAIREFLWSKFRVYLPPLLLLGQLTTVLSNWIIQAPPRAFALSCLTSALVSFAVCGMGIGLGAAWPRFHEENAARIATGYGAIMYMGFGAAAVGLITLFSAAPLYSRFWGPGRFPQGFGGGDHAYLIGALGVGAVTWAAVRIPMWMGEKSLNAMED